MRVNQSLGGAVLHLLPEQPDESLNGIFTNVTAIAPHRVQDRASRQNAARIPHKQLQQPEFGERQINLLPPAESAVGIHVKDEIFEFQDISWPSGCAPLQ